MAFLAPALPVISAVGTGVSAVSAVAGGMAANAEGKANQELANREAAQLDVQAGQERAAGTHNASRILRRSKEILAKQRAQAAAGGGSTSDGSVAALRSEAVGTASLNQLLAMTEADERAQSIETQATSRRHSGRLARFRGRQAMKGAVLQGAGTLLSGAADWGEKFG